MKRRYEPGFSIVELLFVMVVIGAIAGIGAWVFVHQKRVTNNVSVKKAAQNMSNAKPVLHNLGGVYLAAYNKTTGLAGDFTFTKSLINPTKDIETAFTFFGQPTVLPGKVTRPNPSFDMRGISKQIDIVSAIDGKVLYIKEHSSSKDYQVTLAVSDDSTWFVVYDHVVDLRAVRGESVVAGQVLGRVAPYINGTFYYDLHIEHKDSPTGDVVEYLCPSTLLDSTVRPAYIEGLNLFARDWSDFMTKDVYGSQDGGCMKTSLKASEVAS
jgi:prepilin-type N-terminal cleavage/methylation domain-containing protein